MKKLWLIMLAVALAFGLVFGIAGCRDVPEKGGDAEELEITDAADIGAMLTAMGYYGAAAGVEADGNKASFNLSEGHDNYGFKLDFAEYVESGHTSLEITFKLAEVVTLTGGHAKIGFKAAVGSDVTPYATHEIVFGGVGNVGKEFVQSFSLSSPNKLPNKYVLFNHNKYGDDATNQGSTGATVYTVEITKLKFIATEPVPCCTDCDVATCKDCSEDKCEGECGTVCCLNFNGTETTKIELVSGKVVHTNPPVVAAAGGAVMKADGTVTMNNYSLLFYKFPEDTSTYKIADYDYIEIFYTLSNAVNTGSLTGTNLKVEMRDYKGADGYTFEGGSYQNFGGVGSDSHQIQTWGDNGTGGFAIRMNSWDVNPAQGDGSCAEKIDIKITKIEFSKGTRYTVEFFSPMTPANNNLPKLQVLSGNGLADRMPKLTHNGWNFLGWVDNWDPEFNVPAGNDIGESTPITKNTTLFAKWAFLPPPTALTITVDGASVISPVTAVGGSYTYLADGKGIRFTPVGQYGNGYPVFEINFAGTDRLSDFSELSYTIKGINNQYKGARLFAKASVFSGDVTAAGGIVFFTETVGNGTTGYQNQGTPYPRTLTIDTSAVGALDANAKIFIAIDCQTATGDIWEISNIELSK